MNRTADNTRTRVETQIAIALGIVTVLLAVVLSLKSASADELIAIWISSHST